MTATAPATFLEYSDREHRYFADGREFRSVTQILNAAGLISPYCRDEEARDRGVDVHALTALDDGLEIPLDLRRVPPRLRGYLKAWRQYRADTGFTPTMIEYRVDCLEFRYSGRFDRLGTFPGQSLPTIIDLKTAKSGAVPKYARLQLVAYGYALDPKKLFGRITVSLRPDGRYNSQPYPIADYQSDKAEWLQMVRNTEEGKNGHSNSRTDDAVTR
jgi:hypothetical protein